MSERKTEEVHLLVREAYGRVASGSSSCCGPAASSCCGPSSADLAARSIGYSEEDLKKAPEGSNLGLGCGNPLAQAEPRPGEVVVDLGSGAGFDAFLAAQAVGASGRVIGVDMTPQMLERARANALKSGAANVEFRQGYIESMPLGDGVADLVISNCVINLSPDKPAVFREAFRVLKDGGRLVVSDIVLRGQLPEALLQSVAAYAGCIAGASQVDDYLEAIRKAGFEDIEVVEEGGLDPDAVGDDPIVGELIARTSPEEVRRAALAVRHAVVRAIKPGR